MGDFRLIDGEGALLTSFEAVDDATATRTGRRLSRGFPLADSVFSVQRAGDGVWHHVATWVTRGSQWR